MTTNLIDGEILASPIFKPLPRFDEVTFRTFTGKDVQVYLARHQGQAVTVLSQTIIRREEKDVWDACEDLLGRAVKDAAFQVRGTYRFDLLSFDAHREINAFNFQDLTLLIVNHSRKLSVGQQQLIKYGSCYGLLTQLGESDWGKTFFKPHVDVLIEPLRLDLFLRKFLREGRIDGVPVIAVVNDQSLTPVLSLGSEEQQGFLLRLKKDLSRYADMPEIYICSHKQTVELVSRLGLWEGDTSRG